MELLPLPNFYHVQLFLLLLLLMIITVVFTLFRRKKRNPPLDFNDPYALTIALRKKKPTKEIKELLKELENYKYIQNPPKLPKLLKKRIRKVLQ